ncbi:MAG: chain-length determining protein [Bacteroidaceae bacterium]|nr:chain-length determining protein [Bacteroidaceae bacterium]
MEEKKKSEVIDLRIVWKKLVSRKKLFLKTLSVAFVLACIWILPQPRIYEASVMLAPETSGDLPGGGSLGSIASSFGINIGNMTSNDAIYPMLYPDIISSTDFIVSLFDVEVRTMDGTVQTDYYTYLTQHWKRSPWDYPKLWLKRLKAKIMPKKKRLAGVATEGGGRFNSFLLSEEQHSLVESLTSLIKCDVDKKTDVISITVYDQDPLISASLADSVRVRLQNFITDYRTSKARVDLQYYEQLMSEAKQEYERSLKAYSQFVDAHSNTILQSYISERDKLENEQQLAFNAYGAMITQYQAAKAKVQEKTPAFTILQGPTVPVKATSPKRMVFVAAILFLTFIGTIFYIFKDDLIQQIVELK